MKTIEDMKLELLSDNSNKFMQTLIDYDIKSKDKYGSNLLHYYIMNYDSIVHPAGVIISEFIKKGLDINDKRKDGRTANPADERHNGKCDNAKRHMATMPTHLEKAG